MRLTLRTRGLLHALLLTAAACGGFASPKLAQAYEDGWRTCAEEDQTCRVAGRAVVRYGADGRWVSRDGSNGVPCRNDYFGAAPYPGRGKTCEIKR